MTVSPRRRVIWAALVAALLTAACAGTDGATTSVADTQPETTTAAPTSTTEAPGTTTATSTTSSSTSTEPPPTTEEPPPPEGDPNMVLTQIVFGGIRYVVITNVGQGPGTLRGLWLCQRPGYFELPDAELAPGEAAAIVVAGGELPDIIGVVHAIDAGLALGRLDPLAGEMALYASSAFAEPDAILGYVRWGERAPTGRSETAVAAGVWEADSTVITSLDVLAINLANLPAVSAEDWSVDIGV